MLSALNKQVGKSCAPRPSSTKWQDLSNAFYLTLVSCLNYQAHHPQLPVLPP